MQYDIQVCMLYINLFSWRQWLLLDTRSYYLQDRRKVYAILEGEGIEIPRYAVLDRDSPDPKRKYLII